MGRPKGTYTGPKDSLVGRVFGMLTVLEIDPVRHVTAGGYEKIKWVCKCECGTIMSTSGENLKSGGVKSCGCNKASSLYKYLSYEYNRDANLKKCYGMSLVEWQLMFEEQNYCCAICGTTEPRGSNWHTDHCHATKKVRGILCGWCNTGIGKLQESPDVFRKALLYLEKAKDEGTK